MNRNWDHQNWKNIHIMGENRYNGSITKYRKQPWDFSHLPIALRSAMIQKPGTDAYLYCGIEGCFDVDRSVQAPYVVALLIPAGSTPSSFVAYTDIQNQKEIILSFDHPNVQLRWEQQLRRTRSGGGVYFLKCDEDMSSVPDGEAEQNFHEDLDIYCLCPSDYKRNRNDELIVSDITYSVIHEGEEYSLRFDRRDETWAEHVEAELDALFDITEDSPQFAEFELKLKNAKDLAVDQKRQQLEEKIQQYGGAEILGIFKVYPRNFPSQTRTKLSAKYLDLFPNKEVVSMDVSSWTVLARSMDFDVAQGADSPFGKLCEALLVEFLVSTGCIAHIPRGILSVFGLSRIAQYFGQDLNMFAFSRKPVLNFLRETVVSVMRKVRIKGTLPKDMDDFVINYMFPADENVLLEGENLLPEDNFPALLHLTGDQLSVSFQRASLDGSPASAPVPIIAATLTKYISANAAVLLIMELLRHPNPRNGIEVPSGARDKKKVKSVRRVDCFKQALLQAPTRTLSPEGKLRLKLTMPNHEMPYEVANECVQKNIKTICLKKEKKNPHQVAMNSEEDMIGEFDEGTGSHSVFIDGKSGTITDPVESFGTVERSSRGLEQLGIEKFHTVTTVRRTQELADKKRSKLQQQLKLPFIKGSAANWEAEG